MAEERTDILKTLQALRLFNEKADKLKGMSFTKQLISEESGFTLKYRKGEEIVEARRQGPTEEPVEAFVLTFRFFVQDNEDTSFRNMANLYRDLLQAGLVQESLVEDFNEACDAMNAYLNEKPYINVTYNGKSFTRRQILDTFVYGGLAHANVNKKVLCDEWKQIPFIFPMLENEFVSILMKILYIIDGVRHINAVAIRELESK